MACRRAVAAALVLAGALAAGCSPDPAVTAGAGLAAGTTMALGAARQVFDAYVADSNRPTPTDSFGSPAYYLPEQAGYPRFFVVRADRTVRGTSPGERATRLVGDMTVPLDGPVLLLFEQSSANVSWRLASLSQLPAGTALPRLAAGPAGAVPLVSPTASGLVAAPDVVGSLQAAVVDDGAASPALAVVARGPLTTGLYSAASRHADGLTAPLGDVYQWQLQGTSEPQLALSAAAGGALVFYTMTLTETVAVPGVLEEADPVRSGRPIAVPADLLPLLPADQPPPRQQLTERQTLTFAALDPVAGAGRIRVVAVGGGITGATAS